MTEPPPRPMTDAEAVGRLTQLAAWSHPAIRYAAVWGLVHLLPNDSPLLRATIRGLELDVDDKVAASAAFVSTYHLADQEPRDEDERPTGVHCPAAIRRATIPPPDVEEVPE